MHDTVVNEPKKLTITDGVERLSQIIGVDPEVATYNLPFFNSLETIQLGPQRDHYSFTQEERLRGQIAQTDNICVHQEQEMFSPTSPAPVIPYRKETGPFFSREQSEITVAIPHLRLLEILQSTAKNEFKDKCFDYYIYRLRQESPYLELTPETIAQICVSLERIEAGGLPGEDRYPRQDTIGEILGILSCNCSRVLTVFSDEKPKQLTYPTDADVELLSRLNGSPTEVEEFTAIMAVTSPHKCFFGNSERGQANLELYRQSLLGAIDYLKTLPVDSPLRLVAQRSLSRQLFHCNESYTPEDTSIFSLDSLAEFADYKRDRTQRPLWHDRLSMFERTQQPWQYQTESDASETDQLAIGITSPIQSMCAFLGTGNYLAYYEATSRLDQNKPEYAPRRVGLEDSVGLLSTGTPDDPYILYGAVYQIGNKLSESLRKTRGYGSATMMLRDATFSRSMACVSDSFYSNSGFHVGKEQIAKTYLYQQVWTDSQRGMYTEAQIHGGIKPEDIDTIYIVEEELNADDRTQMETLIRLAQKRGISVEYV